MKKKMKKMKNEKKRKNGKNDEKKKEKLKNGFTLKILDDFHDFVSECVSFPRKINNPFWGVIVFPKSDNFHWT